MIIDKEFLTDKQKEFINDLFSIHEIPFYYFKHGANEDSVVHFGHQIVKKEIINSTLYEIFAKDVLIQFCNNNNIKLNKIYRCAINITFPLNSIKCCDIHTDHEFDYKHLLLYLNNSDGDTILLEDDKKTEKARITPEQYKGVMFDKCWHYQELPSKLDRKVMVFTFK